ncbi:MAG TPA: radical SAM protein, partial [Tepidiformaceae bacterium]|nr:radical SAM protein [Tepidiformaceae bacterium]
AVRAGQVMRGTTLFMSSVTDPYQPIESKLGLTRSVVEALLPVQAALTVHTRSPVVTRDLDLLTGFESVRVNMSITTDSDEIRQRYEPHAPSIDARLRAATAVAGAGIPLCIFVSPMLPIRDVRSFAERLAATGASSYATQPLYPVRGEFMSVSTSVALAKAREDGWTDDRVAAAQEELGAALEGRLVVRWKPG